MNLLCAVQSVVCSKYKSCSTMQHHAAPYRLNEPLLWGYFQHVVQLQPGRGELLLGGPVVTLALPLPPGHHEEHGQPHQGDEGHAPHYRPNYEG